MLDRFEVCISYTGTARESVRGMVTGLSGLCRFYVYEDNLDAQTGLYIADISTALYCRLPCIILATRDWYTRPATIFELECMKANPSKKLLFDFCGSFAKSEAADLLAAVDIGVFDERGEVDTEHTRKWVLSLASVTGATRSPTPRPSAAPR